MNIASSFVTYLETLTAGTFNSDIFIGGAPLDAPDSCWWVVASGGSPLVRNETGELSKEYVLDVFYRDTSMEAVYDAMQTLEIDINAGNCTALSGFDTIDITATIFPADQDLDGEDRTVGLVQVSIRTYYK